MNSFDGHNNMTYSKALEGAERGHAESQYQLAEILRRSNTREAADLLLKAASQGHSIAQYKLGIKYEIGRGVELSFENALLWYRKAAENGIPDAEQKLWQICLDGKGGEWALKIVEWYQSIEDQYNMAPLRLGYLFLKGIGTKRNLSTSIKWYRIAAKSGSTLAELNLGEIYSMKSISDFDEASYWFLRAAQKNDPDAGKQLIELARQGVITAQYNLGIFYAGFDEQSYHWFRKAAESGHAEAQYKVGVIYEYGKHVSQSYQNAHEWYRRASKQGLSKAQDRLGRMYKSGKGVEKDYERAVTLFREASERGYTKAQIHLGNMYSEGKGVEQDDEHATELYLSAVDTLTGESNSENNADSINSLGNMYRTGKGVEQNSKKALECYQDAAELESILGMANLGHIYIMEGGNVQNYDEGMKWFREAAKIGHAEAWNLLIERANKGECVAQYNLARIYEDRGYRYKDRYMKWYDQASQQGHTQAIERFDRIIADEAQAQKDEDWLWSYQCYESDRDDDEVLDQKDINDRVKDYWDEIGSYRDNTARSSTDGWFHPSKEGSWEDNCSQEE
jgi:TPR repeat protein